MKNIESSDYVAFDEQGLNIYQNYIEIISKEMKSFGELIKSDIIEPFIMGLNNTEEGYKMEYFRLRRVFSINQYVEDLELVWKNSSTYHKE